MWLISFIKRTHENHITTNKKIYILLKHMWKIDKTKHVPGPKSGFNKYKDSVIETMFIGHSAIMLEINNKKTALKSSYV